MSRFIDRLETIEKYKREHERLRQLVIHAPEKRLLRPRTFGEWSVKDIVAHLAAWNWEAIGEVGRVLKNQSTWPDKYEGESCEDNFNQMAVEARRKITWDETLKDWDNSFWAQIQLMEHLSENEWRHQSGKDVWADGGPVTTWSLFAYEYEGEGHEGGHAKQVEKLLN